MFSHLKPVNIPPVFFWGVGQLKRLCLVNSTISGNDPSQIWTRLTYLNAKLKISESNVPLFLPKTASYGF